jgi:hypothetical protein
MDIEIGRNLALVLIFVLEVIAVLFIVWLMERKSK